MVDVLVAVPLGAPKNLDFIAKDVPCVAADGGYTVATTLGLNCVAIIGDMDSIEDTSVLRSKSLYIGRYPVEKNASDATLALAYAHENYGNRIALVGGSGGRIDHFLGLVQCFDARLRPTVWLTDTSCLLYCLGKCSFQAPIGTQISVITHMFEPASCETKGLYWDFDRLGHNSISLSNKTSESRVIVTCEKPYYIIFDIEQFTEVSLLEHMSLVK